MHIPLRFLPLLPAVWGLHMPVQESSDVSVQKNWEIRDCSTPDLHFRTNSLELSPESLTPGKTHNVTLEGSLGTTLNMGAEVIVTVKIGSVQLLNKRFDICQTLRDRGTSVQCPVEPGIIEIKDTFDLPEEIPAGKFSVSVRAFLASGEGLACIDLTADFTNKGSRVELK